MSQQNRRSHLINLAKRPRPAPAYLVRALKRAETERMDEVQEAKNNAMRARIQEQNREWQESRELDQYPTWVYVVKESESTSMVKVGISSNPLTRLIDLQGGNPRLLLIHTAIRLEKGIYARAIERQLLERFPRLVGEWVYAHPDFVAETMTEFTAAAGYSVMKSKSLS